MIRINEYIINPDQIVFIDMDAGIDDKLRLRIYLAVTDEGEPDYISFIGEKATIICDWLLNNLDITAQIDA